MTFSGGMAYLVGAGPGDPGLITVRGWQVLSSADAVVYDALIHPALLSVAPRGATLHHVGKRGGRDYVPQAEIDALLVELVKAGKRVVRLKGGDPFIFGRGGQEMDALRRAGLPYEIVPGVTAAVGAGAWTEVPLTDRRITPGVVLLTGYEQEKDGEGRVPWGLLARSNLTLVIYMGVKRLPVIVSRLLEGGMDRHTPVIVTSWATHACQRTVHTHLAEVVERLADAGVQSPALVMIGGVVSLAPPRPWPETRPLFGRRCAVVGTVRSAARLRRLLEDAGAEVIEVPAIETRQVEFEVPDWREWDWLIFTSANALRHLLEGWAARADLRQWSGKRLAAVGPGTAAALAEKYLVADLVLRAGGAQSLSEELQKISAPARALFPCGKSASRVLETSLVQAGWKVKRLEVYQTESILDVSRIGVWWRQFPPHWIIFTSASAVDSLAQTDLPVDSSTKIATMGAMSSAAVRQQGWVVDLEARETRVESLVDGLIQYEEKRR